MKNRKSDDAAYLFLWEGIFLYTGNSISTNTHEHHALQIIICKDEPFRMRILDGEWKYYKSLIINSDKPHECILDSGRVFFLGIDPESYYGIKIKKNFLSESQYVSISQDTIDNFMKQIEPKLIKIKNPGSVLECVKDFIQNLAGSPVINIVELDKRVEKVINILKNSLTEKVKLSKLADEVCLSETRLVHLFKEQTGIPIRKYILWYRINSAVKEVINGNNLTEAAHLAGFSDAAHFSRTFRRMFGISPADFLKNSQNIQAFACID